MDTILLNNIQKFCMLTMGGYSKYHSSTKQSSAGYSQDIFKYYFELG